MNYYERLGLSNGADEKEIKKAYFKKIRQYNPEKAPEEFKKIREAYEQLQNPENRKKCEQLINLENPYKQMYEKVLEYGEMHQLEEAIAVCKEAISFGEHKELFLKKIGELYLANEENGKAVKSFEQLCDLYPENLDYQNNLANAYYKRGFNKKAKALHEKLYEIGYGNAEYLADYISSDYTSDMVRKREAALKLIQIFPETKKENYNNVMYAFETVIEIDLEKDVKRLEQDFAALLSYLRNNKDKMYLLENKLLYLLHIMSDSQNMSIHIASIFLKFLTDLEIDPGVTGEKVRKEIVFVRLVVEEFIMQEDKRLGNTVQEALQGYILKKQALKYEILSGIENEEDWETMELEIKLTILSEMPEIRKELDIVKKDYPVFANEIKGILDEIENCNNLSYLRSKVEKRLKQKLGYPSNSHLIRKKQEANYDDLEDEFNFCGDEFDCDNSFYQQPYKREEKKVGRNDPCPCGSGRKYKQCCGK